MKEEKPLGMVINKTANLIRREVDKNIHRHVVDDNSRCNGWIIHYIMEHPGEDVFQKDLENEFSLTRSNISKVVDLMVKKGLIVRSPVEYDARLKKLTLTQKAIENDKKIREQSNRFEACLVKGFSQKEITQMRDFLRRMEENISTLNNEENKGGYL